MSDYISKSVLIEDVHKIRCQNGISEEVGHNRPLTDIANVYECINNQSTLDEKEIIRKAFERVLTRLEGKKWGTSEWRDKWRDEIIGECIEVVKEEGGIE